MAKAETKTVGNFDVERELAQGGMGVVLLARQPSVDRPVILKKIRRDLTNRSEAAKRFEREAKIAASIHHQNVVAVYDLFSHKSDRYIAQEFVDGVDLCTVLDKKGPMPWKIAAMVALEVTRGLEEIHAHGTVHRDIKPSNILLGCRGEVKIADFGIALEPMSKSLTTPGMMIGTPPYSPPEQMLGERMDTRGDLYSLGVVVYTMLAGEPPFPETGEEAEGLFYRMQKEQYRSIPPAVNRVPGFLFKIVQHCLRANPNRRPASTRELRLTLERELGHPSPADCRAALAQWLRSSKLVESDEKATVAHSRPRPVRSPVRPPFPKWRFAFGGMLLLGIATIAITKISGRSVSEILDESSELANDLPKARRFLEAMASGIAAPARLRINVDAGATVLIDGQAVPPPANEVLELPAGTHVVVIDGGKRGRAEHEIVLSAGEEQVLEPKFQSKRRN